MGANDWAYGVPLGEPDTLDARTFFGAYQLMLRRLKAAYPAARVVCATLLRGQDPADGPLFFNAEAAGPMEPYNEVIRAACGLEGCQVADLAATCPAYATLDGVHPNAAGMGQLASDGLPTCKSKSTGGPGAFSILKAPTACRPPPRAWPSLLQSAPRCGRPATAARRCS